MLPDVPGKEAGIKTSDPGDLGPLKIASEITLGEMMVGGRTGVMDGKATDLDAG